MMAKRKSEVQTKPWSAGSRYYDVWIDETLEGRLKAIEGIHEVVGPLKHWASAYYILLDPRYDADEVIAEIAALGEPVVEPEKPKLWQLARALGKDAATDCSVVETGRAYLKAAEETYKDADRYKKSLWVLAKDILNRLEYGRW